MILGIDPGLTGALAILDTQGRVSLLEDLPTVHRGSGKVKRELDPAGLTHLLRPHAPMIRLALVEAVASRPGQGVASVFSLGHTLGVIHGVLAAMGIPWQPVTPSTWKKSAGLGTDKEASRAMAARLYPSIQLHRKADHNLAEALLIARHGLVKSTAH
ncbi:MAG: crossover junction endodeoxyribonuclease RuvC [Halothiobacillaceae bacterium]|nr:MAG: crossover junction endodeoxyribonuclease RuvC [Halothiobacillaceae bacterium]